MKYLEIQTGELELRYLQENRDFYPGPGWYFIKIEDHQGQAALVNVPIVYEQKPVVVWRGPEAEIKSLIVDTIPDNQAARGKAQNPDGLLPGHYKPAPIDTQQALCMVMDRQADLIEALIMNQHDPEPPYYGPGVPEMLFKQLREKCMHFHDIATRDNPAFEVYRTARDMPENWPNPGETPPA